MKCVICSSESGRYILCRACNEKKNKGEIIKCKICGNWHHIGKVCTDPKELESETIVIDENSKYNTNFTEENNIIKSDAINLSNLEQIVGIENEYSALNDNIDNDDSIDEPDSEDVNTNVEGESFQKIKYCDIETRDTGFDIFDKFDKEEIKFIFGYFLEVLKNILDFLSDRILIFIGWVKSFRKSNRIYEVKESLMSKTEITYFNIIKEVLPKGYLVFPQMNLAAFIDKTDGTKYRSELFRNVDFLITDYYYKPCVIIEINDHTHLRKDRRIRDKKVKEICNEAGIEIINFWVSYGISKSYIEKRILEILFA